MFSQCIIQAVSDKGIPYYRTVADVYDSNAATLKSYRCVLSEFQMQFTFHATHIVDRILSSHSYSAKSGINNPTVGDIKTFPYQY